MATFQELMQAAVNADKAGDENAARQLVQMAQSIGKQAAPTAPAVPEGLTPSRIPEELPAPPAPQGDRFGDTFQYATEGPLAGLGAHFKGVFDQRQSPTMQNMPDWVPEAARGPAALAGDIGMTALYGLGSAYAAGAGLVGEAFGGSPTNERRLAGDLMAAGEVAAPELAGVAGTIQAAPKIARAAARLEDQPTRLQSAARAADDLGITPSLGAGGKFRGMLAAGYEKNPVTGHLIARDAERFVGEVESVFNRNVAAIGKATTPTEAGENLQRGLETYVATFKARATRKFDEVGKFIPRGTAVTTERTANVINDALKVFEGKPAIAKQLGLDKWSRVVGELGEGMPWNAAQRLRSSIGESIGKINGPLANADQGLLKRAYAALTEDLEAAALKAGPEARTAWKSANTFYKNGAERISGSLDKTISAQSPERAFEAFVNMARKDRASSDVKRMYAIRNSMPKSEWDSVAASIVDRLGNARPGQQGAAGGDFSLNTFLTNWNGLSPQAKSTLLPKGVQEELSKLAEVVELGKKANAERNASNTGTVGTIATVGYGLSAAPGTTMTFLGGSWGSGKILTSVTGLRALNRMARGDTGAMKVLAKSGGPIAEEAKNILRISAADASQGEAPANINAPSALRSYR